jgi:PhnB protein
MMSTENVMGIVPMLICRDAAAELEFCARAFGAVELSRRSAEDGSVMHATLWVANALLMVHGEVASFPSQGPAADGSSPVVIYLYVEDADRVLERAVAAGARLTLPPVDAPWGDRVGRIVDPAGHVWNVASRPAPASGAT